MALNRDCLAQDRPRELKLVSLELSEKEDSEYVIKIVFLCLQVNEVAIQNVLQNIFCSRWGGEGGVGHMCPQS
jgi:hypothetical protein